MNIAIDYDNTYTRCRVLFEKIILLFKDFGHNVFIVTCRHEGEPIDDCNNITKIYTSRIAKYDYCQNIGLKIDIWIDDNPQYIVSNAI